MNATGITELAKGSVLAERDLRRLQATSAKVVGSAFYGTMLKMMRESKLKGSVGHGGRGEEVFAAQLHQMLAERMGASISGGPQDALFQSLAQQQSLISRRLEAGMVQGTRAASLTKSMTELPATRAASPAVVGRDGN